MSDPATERAARKAQLQIRNNKRVLSGQWAVVILTLNDPSLVYAPDCDPEEHMDRVETYLIDDLGLCLSDYPHNNEQVFSYVDPAPVDIISGQDCTLVVATVTKEASQRLASSGHILEIIHHNEAQRAGSTRSAKPPTGPN